jgi:hypothetical protein
MERKLPGPARKDPYREQAKPEGNPQCPSCKAVSIVGRWVPEPAARETLGRGFRATDRSLCPSCRKLRDRYAQGVVEIRWSGNPTTHEKLAQILETANRSELIERSRNDQDRILWSKTYRGVTRIYTALPELARHIGRTLEKTFHGRTVYKKSAEEPFLFVVWEPFVKVGARPVRRRGNERSKSYRGRGRVVSARRAK